LPIIPVVRAAALHALLSHRRLTARRSHDMSLLEACKNRPLGSLSGIAVVALALAFAIPSRSIIVEDSALAEVTPAVHETDSAPLPVRVAQLPPVESEPRLPAPPLEAPPEKPAAKPVPPQTLPAVEDRLELKTLSAAVLHQRLEKAFGRAIPRMPDDGTPWLRFSIDAGGGSPVLIAANQQSREVRLVGRPEQLRAWRQIITAIDAPAAADRVTQLIAADRKAAPQIKQTVGVLTAQVQQPRDAREGIAGLAQAAEQGLLGPVQIDVVEGTDFFIIRGNPRDVERVLEVIRQIEAMSRVSEPQVVVHPLTHVNSEAMALLMAQIFGAAPEGGYSLAGFYGPISILPLGRPNAVLLIGSPSTVAKAQELLRMLDISGEATTQFEVFKLKNATAEEARVLLEPMFAPEPDEETGLIPPFTPKAMVFAETRTNSLIVRAAPRDMDEIRRLIEQIDQPGGERVNEMRVFRLQNTLATEMATLLQRAFRGGGQGDSPSADPGGLASLLKLVTIDAQGQQVVASGVLAGVTVNADQRANSLIISAPPESMDLIAALIRQLDVAPNAVAEIRVFTITNGDAVALAEMLQDLFGTGEQGGQQGGGGPGGAAAQAGNRIFGLRFSVDERTNSIIAAGSADELIVVEAVLTRLDASDSRQRINRVYKLKNADAEQVAFALQDWLQQKREVEATAPGVASPFQQLEREVVVVAEINSNSLIVSATPTYFRELTEIIQQIDEQAPIVMIQVLIGEVALGDTDEFGVELGLQDSVLFDRSLLENIQNITTTTQTQSAGGAVTTVTQQQVQAATLTPGFGFGNPATGLGNSGSDRSIATAGAVGAQSLSSFGVGRVSQAAGFGGFVLSASSESLSFLLRALQESQRLEVLSRPQIMALDNQTGRAFVGQVVPYITQSTLDLGGARTNSIEFQNVGLELLVRPRISPEDLVVMEVYAAKSQLGAIEDGVPVSIAPNGDAINAPIIDTISAETTISAVSGQTVVLSGLLTKRDRELHRRVPLLADIPLLGDLFRFDSKQVERAELLIVLTPHVIRSRHQSEMIKQVESSRISWCLSDVVDMHGPAGLRSRQDPLGAAEAETVFPVEVPGDHGIIIPGEPGAMATPPPAPPAVSAPPGELPPPPNTP
jgi:type II secretion system protein D